MLIPDCRHDKYYNEDFLPYTGKSEVTGYDWCAEEVVDSFFDNLGMYFNNDSYLMHLLNEKLPEDMQEDIEIEHTFGDKGTEIRKVETYKDLLRSRLNDWIESARDKMITSMIDRYAAENEEEYKARREKVLAENAASKNPKEYYDTKILYSKNKRVFKF